MKEAAQGHKQRKGKTIMTNTNSTNESNATEYTLDEYIIDAKELKSVMTILKKVAKKGDSVTISPDPGIARVGALEVRIPKIHTPGFALDVKNLFTFTRKAKGTVTFTNAIHTVTVTVNGIAIKLESPESDEIVEFDKNAAVSFEVNTSFFDKLREAYMYTVKNDKYRPVMGGVLVDEKNIVGTDGLTLYMAPHEIEGVNPFILPPHKLLLDKKLFAKGARFRVNDDMVRISTPQMRLTLNLVDGVFPGYAAVVDTLCERVEVVVPPQSLEQLLGILESFPGDASEQLELTAQDGKLNCATVDDAISFSVDIDMGEGSIKEYVKKDLFIRAISSTPTTLRQGKENQALVFELADGGMVLLMPCRG